MTAAPKTCEARPRRLGSDILMPGLLRVVMGRQAPARYGGGKKYLGSDNLMSGSLGVAEAG